MERALSTTAFEEWVQSVASGDATMSQRNIRWVEANGGPEMLVTVAKRHAIHIVQLTDDKGNQLFAASKSPFTTLC